MSDTPTPSEPAVPESAPAPHHGATAPHPTTAVEHHAEHAPPRPRSRAQRWLGGMLVYLVGIGVVAAAVVGARALARTRGESAHAEGSARARDVAAGPRVSVTRVGRSQAERTLSLLGEARPYATTTLYGKISGYLRELRVDRGDRVTPGQILAVIDSPETEHQLHSARIDAANRHVAANRARRLAAPGLVTEQDAENAETSARIADASVGAIASQRGYRLVRAPYAGVVTARFADVGSLVQSATGSQAGALPVVRISDVDRLRVFVYLGQRDASVVRVGDTVRVASPDRPESETEARVSRASDELDARTRTMLTEIDVDNRDGRFVAGSYLNVSMRVHQPTYPEVPTEALVLRGPQTFIAVVGDDNRVHYQAVHVLDDDGTRARILSGVREGDRIALNLGDSVEDGTLVQPVAAPPPPGAPARPQGGQPPAGPPTPGAPAAPQTSNPAAPSAPRAGAPAAGTTAHPPAASAPGAHAAPASDPAPRTAAPATR